jgi:hypothetical protein
MNFIMLYSNNNHYNSNHDGSQPTVRRFLPISHEGGVCADWAGGHLWGWLVIVM